jgi:H+-transporting ATPase
MRPGDLIAADVTLLTGVMSVDQSVLTGESKEAGKQPCRIVFGSRRNEDAMPLLLPAPRDFSRRPRTPKQARLFFACLTLP